MVRIVLTGGPGVGKTTLLQELQRRGFRVVGESAREVIQQRKSAGLPPRPGAVAFARDVLARDKEKYLHLPAGSETVFFDRSALEALGMLHAEGALNQTELATSLERLKYHKLGFVLPPWQEIYAQDEERDHSFEHCVKVHGELQRWYERCGYVLNLVPFLPVSARADYVLQSLESGV